MKRLTLLGLLVASLFVLAPAKPAKGYWCPSYSRYCSRNVDCRGYCGPGVHIFPAGG